MVVGNHGERKLPTPLGDRHDYFITQKGELQVKNNKFPLILLCALLAVSGLVDSIYMRIAIAANALVVLAGVIKTITEYSNGKEN